MCTKYVPNVLFSLFILIFIVCVYSFLIQQLSSLHWQYFKLYKCKAASVVALMYVKYTGRFNNVIFSLTTNSERRNQLIHKAGFIIFFEVVCVDRYIATNEINKNKKSRFIHHFGILEYS